MGYAGLRLPLPPQHPPRPGDFDLRPRQVRAWLDDLPLANPVQTTQRLLTLLAEANALQLPWRSRLDLLLVLRPLLVELERGQRQRLLREGLPLSERSLVAAGATMQLQQQAALAFAAAAATLLAEGAERQPEALAFALLNAVRRLSSAALLAWQTRLPLPTDLWQQLGQLYDCAEYHRLSRYRPPQGRSDIEGCYKQLLLLAAADPYRLRPEDLEHLFELLRGLAPLAALTPWSPTDEPEVGEFLFDLAANSEPRRSGWSPAPAAAEGWRRLSVLPLLDPLVQQAPPSLANTTRALVERWAQPVARNDERAVVATPIELIAGLAALHTALLHTQRDPAPLGALFTPPNFTVRAPHLAPDQAETVSIPTLSDNSATHAQRWITRDMSQSGMRIALDQPLSHSELSLKSGDLVGLRGLSGEVSGLAAVRWLRYDSHGRPEAGLERICYGQPQPAASRRGSGLWQRAVAVATRDDTAGWELLLPPHLFVAGQRIEVRLAAGTALEVTLPEPHESSSGFSRFAIPPLPAAT